MIWLLVELRSLTIRWLLWRTRRQLERGREHHVRTGALNDRDDALCKVQRREIARLAGS